MVAKSAPGSNDVPATPLLTRHVFLDTEVYRRAGFNIKNSQFTLLQKLVSEGRVQLHVPDVVEMELRRQISEEIHEIAARASDLGRRLSRLHQIAPGVAPLSQGISDIQGDAVFSSFRNILFGEFRAHAIDALLVRPQVIFERYFSGRPPFEARGSKEFPDAFVIEGIHEYCRANSLRMYVVSGDDAVRRAATTYPNLIAVKTIEDILAAAAAGADNLEAVAEDIFGWSGFDYQLENALNAEVGRMELTYYGNRPDGRAGNASVDEIIELHEYRIVSYDAKTIGLVLNVFCRLLYDVDFSVVDETGDYSFDRDVVRSSTTSNLRIFISVNLENMAFNEAELLTGNVLVE